MSTPGQSTRPWEADIAGNSRASTPSSLEEEMYELNPEGQLPRPRARRVTPYQDGTTIDWLAEESFERERAHYHKSQRGVRGLLLPLLDSSRMWIIILATGISIGFASAWLDVLVKWLSDLREGRCSYGLFYNQVKCCSGMDVTGGDVCQEWRTWSQYFNIQNWLFLSSLLQATIYVVLALAFAGSAAVLVQTYAPYAFHTGIPEIKAILGGYVFDAFLGPWTLIIKSLGLALAVASGLSLGKEGPLVHVACCMAYLYSRVFKEFRHNEAQKRKLLAAAATAGVSVAFGSPLGGVLFGLEELDTFGNESEVMWRGFVTSMVAAMGLQYIDPFGTSKLVLFQVTSKAEENVWRAFELIPWLGLGVLGGVLGSLLIKLNVVVATYRRNSILHDFPITEVVGVAGITAGISYLVVFSRVQSAELIQNLFQECDKSKPDYHGLCNPNATLENIFLLILTAIVKIGLTAWTFGMQIPAGIFLPTISIGACLGRAVGLIMQGLYRMYPEAWFFSACPPDPTVGCVSPGFYAVLGAAGMLGGVTRMTVSLVVILFELTGALSHVLPIMIVVMTSKWVGEAIGKDGIYTVWIAMRRYPWLPPDEWRDHGETGEHLMTPFERLVVIQDGEYTVKDLEVLLEKHQFHGFPVVEGRELLGYVTADKLRNALAPVLAEDIAQGERRKCRFSSLHTDADAPIDFSAEVEEAVVQLRKEVPQELVVSMFQKMNVRHVLFTHAGQLTGMVGKSDVVALLTSHFKETGALAT